MTGTHFKGPVYSEEGFIGGSEGNSFFTLDEEKGLRFIGDTTLWDDLRFPVIGRNLDTASGRIDYDYTELGVNFAYNSRYAETEQISIIAQMPHAKKLGSDIDIHIHWTQVKDYIPNILIEYRWYKNGSLVPSTWEQLYTPTQVAEYSSGSLAQISDFGMVSPPEDESVSSLLEIKLYRDAGNTSGVFAGADPYNTGGNASWLVKELDIHFEVDSLGSDDEYSKTE